MIFHQNKNLHGGFAAMPRASAPRRIRTHCVCRPGGVFYTNLFFQNKNFGHSGCYGRPNSEEKIIRYNVSDT